jgi:hypothetical protein
MHHHNPEEQQRANPDKHHALHDIEYFEFLLDYYMRCQR